MSIPILRAERTIHSKCTHITETVWMKSISFSEALSHRKYERNELLSEEMEGMNEWKDMWITDWLGRWMDAGWQREKPYCMLKTNFVELFCWKVRTCFALSDINEFFFHNFCSNFTSEYIFIQIRETYQEETELRPWKSRLFW